jgi:UDP-N-acetylmuramate: L-alanyl-gamma-D-glutamyl-meso-diaminopimelate ligase
LSRILGGGKEFYTENLGWFPEKNNCVPETWFFRDACQGIIQIVSTGVELRFILVLVFYTETSKTKLEETIGGSHGKASVIFFMMHYHDIAVDYMSRRTIRRIRYHGTLTEENDFIVLGGGEPSSGDRRQNFICSLTLLWFQRLLRIIVMFSNL